MFVADCVGDCVAGQFFEVAAVKDIWPDFQFEWFIANDDVGDIVDPPLL